MNFQPADNRVLLFSFFLTAYWNVCFWYPFWKKIHFFIFNFVYMCMSMSTYGYRCPWKPEREPDAFQPELQAVGSYLTQVLRTKLRSSVWVVSTPHSGIIYSSPISFSKGWIRCYQSYLKIVVSSQLYFSTPLKEMAGYKQWSLVLTRRR